MVEAELVDASTPHAILAPASFFDNALGGLDELRAGKLVLPLRPDRPLQQLARADLGVVAARALLEPARFVGRRIELDSDAPTPRQMAQTLSDVLGRPIEPVELAPSSMGNPDMRAMWEFLAQTGYAADLAALRSEFPDVPSTSFAEWAATALH